MLSTISHSPDLKDEGNKIARYLLDNEYKMNYVLLYSMFTQSLNILITLLLWMGFLKHKGTFTSIITHNFKGKFPDFIKTALGGKNLTWRQFIIPYKFSEWPNSYHLIWFMAILFMGHPLYRIYLALKWNRIVFISSPVAILITVTLPITVYFIWLYSVYKKRGD